MIDKSIDGEKKLTPKQQQQILEKTFEPETAFAEEDEGVLFVPRLFPRRSIPMA